MRNTEPIFCSMNEGVDITLAYIGIAESEELEIKAYLGHQHRCITPLYQPDEPEKPTRLLGIKVSAQPLGIPLHDARRLMIANRDIGVAAWLECGNNMGRMPGTYCDMTETFLCMDWYAERLQSVWPHGSIDA